MSEFHQASVARLVVYRELSAEAAAVMDQSDPTPTQEENDAAMMGMPHPDEQVADHAPMMPPLHEQYARLAAAAEPKRRAGPPAAHHAAPVSRPPAASAAPDKK